MEELPSDPCLQYQCQEEGVVGLTIRKPGPATDLILPLDIGHSTHTFGGASWSPQGIPGSQSTCVFCIAPV